MDASPDSTRLATIARTTAATHGMLPDGAPVVAMVSGGADSTALVRLLADGVLGAVRLRVLHVDHLLRGAASDADAVFVEQLCAALGVPCRVVRHDVGAYARACRLNVEDAGRRVRYRFGDEELDAWCAECGEPTTAGRLAVAHTLDDQVETVLMRLLGGAGTGGLAGIPAVRGRVVRPLLDARRADVVAHLRALGQAWREDATNADTSRLRARMRAQVVPLLDEAAPAFAAGLRRTVTLLREDDALLDAMAATAAAEIARTLPGEVRFDRSRMRALPRALARRVLRAGVLEAFPEASRIEFEHTDAVIDGLADDGFARDLPEGLRAFTEYATLVISRGREGVGRIEPTLLELPGEADLGTAGRIVAEACEPVAGGGPAVAVIDADRVRGPLTVGAVEPGDAMRPLGMAGTRKLQDVLTDAKVPRRMRPLTPVVRDGERVVWVAGVRLSEDVALRPETSRAWRLTWTGPIEREA